ncbi:MAG: hypothetical protein OXU75_04995 [Deltaproteobacteria bacterium]|nr:hypothetical protein [Deltaproteobacteria bacterium]
MPEELGGWVFPSRVSMWMSLHARRGDVTAGYATDWTVEQLREPAQRIADRIDELMAPDVGVAEAQPPEK